jgi:hypothetical protein
MAEQAADRSPQHVQNAQGLAPSHLSCCLRMILSENRYPSPIGVEDMLFGIMRG